ncbi:MAG: Tab2/Atab2 family RNA-binding protein [Cyanobacteria bacterium P01_F01_bin.42]
MTTYLELDFYSRPILDEKEKKLWEVLICNCERTLEYSKFCSGSEANARWLAEALQEALVTFEQQNSAFMQPEKVRFFRRPMSTIISRACETLNLNAQPSRRTFALYAWLQERYQSFYPQQAGYQPLMPTPPAFEPASPQPLPQTLIGEGWSFVSLQQQAFADLNEWPITFQDQLPPTLHNLSSDAVIPGMVIYSRRSMPLAGWMNGFELGAITYVSRPRPRLILETGITDRWIIANLATPALQKEAETFNQQKQAADQIHFIAVQDNPNSEEFAGFWVLQELLLV